jgi:pimeloyl-[acyl-carrier protein] methyl ester esterase
MANLEESEIYTSEMLAQTLLPFLNNKQTTIIAWSLGGLVALEMLAHAIQLKKITISQLLLVSSTPRFVQSEDWRYAVPAKIFEQFGTQLSDDHQAALRRFLAIQAIGSRTAKEDIKTLQEQLIQRGEPDSRALKWGLTILLQDDKRQLLQHIVSQIKQQNLLISIALIVGKRDTLAIYQGQQAIAKENNLSLYSMDHAGHAPFISHSEEFKQILQKILS